MKSQTQHNQRANIQQTTQTQNMNVFDQLSIPLIHKLVRWNTSMSSRLARMLQVR